MSTVAPKRSCCPGGHPRVLDTKFAVCFLAAWWCLTVSKALAEPPTKTGDSETEKTGEAALGPRINASRPPGTAPKGMVWIPGGWFWRGDETLANARPVRLVYVDGFWMDKTEVTNREFARFVKATGYVTIVERKLEPKDFPTVPKEKIEATKPFSVVFFSPEKNIDPKAPFAFWKMVPGACWKHPRGPETDLRGLEDHPVVHICWHDAVAYCKWAGKSLPTETEWEFAARGGTDRKKYVWGDELEPNGKFMANYWQGAFPFTNAKKDRFEKTAPVGSFPANGFGLYDMAGNVWEWCADWYHPDAYKEKEQRNPKGPRKSHDPDEPEYPKRVLRGGAFLCAVNHTLAILPAYRFPGEPGSTSDNTGFRCIRRP